MRRTLIASTALTLAGLPALAASHTEGDTEPMVADDAFCEAGYVLFDTNGDGALAPEEVRDTTMRAYNVLDKNADGAVSRTEYISCLNDAAGRREMMTDRSPENMARYDADADGVLTQEEFMSASATSYDALIAGDDDAKTDIQRLTFWPVTADAPDYDGMTVEESAARSAMVFEALDTDDSGTVARDEWSVKQALIADMEKAFTEAFDAADTDESGALSAEEYRALNEARAERAIEAAAEGYDMPVNTLVPDEPAVYFAYDHMM